MAGATVCPAEENVDALPSAAGFRVPAFFPAASAVQNVRPEVHAALPAAIRTGAALSPAHLRDPIAGHGGPSVMTAEEPPEGEPLVDPVAYPDFILFANHGHGEGGRCPRHSLAKQKKEQEKEMDSPHLHGICSVEEFGRRNICEKAWLEEEGDDELYL